MKKTKIALLIGMICILPCLIGCGQKKSKAISKDKNLTTEITEQTSDRIVTMDDLDEEIASAYMNSLKQEYKLQKIEGHTLYYGFGYIDGDDVPELFVVSGDSHTDMVSIYTYDANENKDVFIGTFGGYGYCDYVPYKNKIITNYGNHGYFYYFVTSIEGNETVLCDVMLRDYSREKFNYYGFTVANFTGAMPRDDYNINRFDRPGGEYLIDEKASDEILGGFYEGSESISKSTVCRNEYVE